jgi:hypothetical protein
MKFKGLYEFYGLWELCFDEDACDHLSQHVLETIDNLPGYLVQVEFDNGHVRVRVCASRVHDAVAESLNDTIFLWLNNNGGGDVRSLHSLGSAGMSHYLTQLSLVFPFNGINQKCPDKSWIPRDIDINNPLVIIINGTNQGYPTMVLEVGYKHETYPQLLRDAAQKHMNANTSVQCHIGIKIHRQTARFQIAVTERTAGGGLNVYYESGMMAVHTPCPGVTFTIPKRHIFFAVPAHLISATLTPDLIIPAEQIREIMAKYW